MTSFRYNLKIINQKSLNFKNLKFGIPVKFDIAVFQSNENISNVSTKVEIGSNYENPKYCFGSKFEAYMGSTGSHGTNRNPQNKNKCFEAFNVVVCEGIYKGIELPCFHRFESDQ